jgi:hypothetical protein
MVAEAACCTCRECGAICRGRFNGCPTVWAAAGTAATQVIAPGASHLTLAASPSPFEPPSGPNPLAKRPKHRNKYLARARAALAITDPMSQASPSVVEPEPLDVGDGPTPEPVMAAPLAAAPAPVRASGERPPPPQGLAEIRDRLEGLRGLVQGLSTTLAEPPAPEAGDWA